MKEAYVTLLKRLVSLLEVIEFGMRDGRDMSCVADVADQVEDIAEALADGWFKGHDTELAFGTSLYPGDECFTYVDRVDADKVREYRYKFVHIIDNLAYNGWGSWK